MRWLLPPPSTTASFSSRRMPGVVLRVSITLVCKPCSRSAYKRVVVAMPLIRCIMLSISRSVCKRERTLPAVSKTISPGFTFWPSCINTVVCNCGSKSLNTSRATRTPATIPASLISNMDLPRAEAGMQLKLVWSPSPMSSAKALRIKSSNKAIMVYFFGEFIAKIRSLFQKALQVLRYLCRIAFFCRHESHFIVVG